MPTSTLCRAWWRSSARGSMLIRIMFAPWLTPYPRLTGVLKGISRAGLTTTRSAKNSKNSVGWMASAHLSMANNSGGTSPRCKRWWRHTKCSFLMKNCKKSLKAWIIKEKAVSLQRQEVIPGYLVSYRVGARLNRHYSYFIRELLSMVPLLLFLCSA